MDTAPIRPEERFDEARVAAYLRAHLPEMAGDAPITFAQFPGGKANLTYVARVGDAELVLRRPPLGPVAPGSHDMVREHAVLSVLHRAYPKAPRAYLLCTDPEVMGAPFFVMERRRGTVVREAWPDSLPADDAFRLRVADNVIDALAELHRVDYQALGLGGLGRPGGLRRPPGGRVGGSLEPGQARGPLRHGGVGGLVPRGDPGAAGGGPAPQRLQAGQPHHLRRGGGGGGARLGHGHPGRPADRPGRESSPTGRSPTPATPRSASGGTGLSRVLPASDLIARYAAATGFDIKDLAFYRAFGLYRVAVIAQQIYIRYRRGQTSDPRFGFLGAVVPWLAEDARRAALG